MVDKKVLYAICYLGTSVSGVSFIWWGYRLYRRWTKWKSIPKYTTESDLKQIAKNYQEKEGGSVHGLYCRLEGNVYAQNYLSSPVSKRDVVLYKIVDNNGTSFIQDSPFYLTSKEQDLTQLVTVIVKDSKLKLQASGRNSTKKLTEYSISKDSRIFVIGELFYTPVGERIFIRRHLGKSDLPFIVSNFSEEKLLSDLYANARISIFGGSLLSLMAVVMGWKLTTETLGPVTVPLF